MIRYRAGTLNIEYGTFDNTGSVDVDGGVLNIISGTTLDNTGSVSVSSGGVLNLQGSVSGTGGFNIGAGAILEFATFPAGGQVVTFNGTGGILKMDAPASFAGTIGNFSPGDTIDLGGITNATGAVIIGNTMTVSLLGGGSLHYMVSAPAPGEVLMTADDNNGGTDIFGTVCFLAGTRIADQG